MRIIDKYIKQNPNEEIHLVDKIFGKGNLLINFNYRDPYLNFKQCYLARVDKNKWLNDNADVTIQFKDGIIGNYQLGTFEILL